MTRTMKELESIAHQLQEHLKFNRTSLKNAIEYLLDEVNQAQYKLKNEGQTIVTKVYTCTCGFRYYFQNSKSCVCFPRHFSLRKCYFS